MTIAQRTSGLDRRRDLVTALLGSWIVAGAALDGWAHVTQSNLDPFFTPWHGVLYSGFLGLVAWTYHVHRVTRLSERSNAFRATVAGLGLFAIGGIGDLLWHKVFGVERSLSAVTSPSHIALFIGAVVFVSAPLRASWTRRDEASGWIKLLPALLSTAGLLVLLELAFFFVSPFLPRFYGGLLPLPQRFVSAPFDLQRDLVVGVLAGTVMIFGALLGVASRWQLPHGSVLAMFSVAALPMVAISGFTSTVALYSAVVGGVFVELLLLAMRPTPEQGTSVFVATAASTFWLIHLLLARTLADVEMEPELLIGAPIWAGAIALVMARAQRAG